MIAFQTKKDQKGYHTPYYIDIEFVSENELDIPRNQVMITSAATYKNIIKNLIIEEEELFNKYNKMIEKNDYLSKMIINSERQGLLTRLIQQLSTPYIESLEIELYNVHHYIKFLKDTNSLIRKKIDQFEKVHNNYD